MWCRNRGAGDLRDAEYHPGGKEAPEARAVELGHKKVRADATGQAPCEATERKDRDVHGLALLNEFWCRRWIVVLPECLCIVADVAAQVSGQSGSEGKGIGDRKYSLYRHKANARQQTKHGKQLPKFRQRQQCETPDV